jgi:hypothetical protein
MMGFDFVYAFMALGGEQATNAALAKLRAGQPLSVLEYNTLLGSAAVLQDLLSQQKQPPTGTRYDATTYHGPITAYQGQTIQLVGYFPAPSAPPFAVTFWHALQEAIWNLGSSKKLAVATSDQVVTGDLFAFAGAAAENAIDPVFAPSNLLVVTDPTAGAQFATVFDGARLALLRILSAQAPGATIADASAAEVQAMAQATTLTTAQTQRTRWVQGGAAVLTLLAGGAAALMVPKAAHAASEYHTQRAAMRQLSGSDVHALMSERMRTLSRIKTLEHHGSPPRAMDAAFRHLHAINGQLEALGAVGPRGLPARNPSPAGGYHAQRAALQVAENPAPNPRGQKRRKARRGGGGGPLMKERMHTLSRIKQLEHAGASRGQIDAARAHLARVNSRIAGR